ncbi:MAG: hypothetical protein GY884_33185 [Proteobacteria bacterium]|nr:hypothetical protein [Pseudomonadota bacterium]
MTHRLGSPREFRAMLSPYHTGPTGSLRLTRGPDDLDIVLNQGWAVDVHRPQLQLRHKASSGHLVRDIENAIRRGAPREWATRQATDHLVSWVAEGLQTGLSSEWHPLSARTTSGHPLQFDLWGLSATALERARPPARVAAALQPWLDEGVYVRPVKAHLTIDGVTRRTYELAATGLTLRELVLRVGRGREGRSRACWKALDLLLHLDAIWIGACPEIVELLPRDIEAPLVPDVVAPGLPPGDEPTDDLFAGVDEEDPFGLHGSHVAAPESKGLRPVGAEPPLDLSAPTGEWCREGSDVAELPRTALDRLILLAANLTEASPLARLGFAPADAPDEDRVDDAYAHRILEFHRDHWTASGADAAELAASCRRLLRAARRALEDDEAIRAAHAARSPEEPDPYDLG